MFSRTDFGRPLSSERNW